MVLATGRLSKDHEVGDSIEQKFDDLMDKNSKWKVNAEVIILTS